MSSLYRRTWGSKGRRALLLHGSTSSSSTWWQVGPGLADEGWFVTAVDLPSHGRSSQIGAALTPAAAAHVVNDALPDNEVDLIIGHSFGAAVAVALCVLRPSITRRLVLEELPGGNSVDWCAESEILGPEAARARADPDDARRRTQRDQPLWHEEDCAHAVADIARCAPEEVSAGLLAGADWTPLDLLPKVAASTTLLLAPDRPGRNRLEDATALRGPDRIAIQQGLRARTVVVAAGHCIHRDDPGAWLQTANRA